jgi:two-component system nitrate/nitrite response regulator NarL
MASIVVYTDQPMLAMGMKSLIAGEGMLTLSGCCTQFQALRETLAEARPDLALVDVTHEITGVCLDELQSDAPDCKIILWTENIAADFALQALTMGIRGVLRKSVALDTYLQCLRRVLAGGLWFEKSLTERFRSARRVTLSPRESQLVTLLSRGLKNKEISHELGITEGTVKVYLSHLFQKSGTKDRFELALSGIKNLSMAGVIAEGQGLSSLTVEPLCRA